MRMQQHCAALCCLLAYAAAIWVLLLSLVHPAVNAKTDVCILLFTMRLFCCGVTFWCEWHMHAMNMRWAVLHACICCKMCDQLR